MKSSNVIFIICIIFIQMFFSNFSYSENMGEYKTAKPYTRWWWFASEIDKNDIVYQLDWLKANNFGGVEIAFVYPKNCDSTAKRFEWLSEEWSQAVAFAKKYADSIGLGCDFTFGTLWPFGDSRVPISEGTIFFGDSTSECTMRRTWEFPIKGRVINHLDRKALERYSDRIGSALKEALKGTKSGLFCDSWEVETQKLWTAEFDKIFEKKFGYDIKPFMDSLYNKGSEDNFYDYTKLISKLVLEEFYEPFTNICHNLGGFSRVQCGGAPTDLLTAFSLVDVPETEAILYEPNFAHIPASAALLSKKNIISSETFTCLYGWKRWPGTGPYQKQEQTADLKLLADALFANGVNHIFWHGMPYNKKGDSALFYASVHVGPDANFADELADFNKYLEKVLMYMRKGKACSSIGVYLPLEDAWMAVEYPDSLKLPWVWGQYELRYIKFPDEIKAEQPIWINNYFLKKSKLENGILYCGDAELSALYLDSKYIDYDALKTILKLAELKFPVWIRQEFAEPGYIKHEDYKNLVNKLRSCEEIPWGFYNSLSPSSKILVYCSMDYFCREDGDSYYIFFANPKAKDLKYPLSYSQSYCNKNYQEVASIVLNDIQYDIPLNFAPYQSLLLKFDKNGEYDFIDINFTPKTPIKED